METDADLPTLIKRKEHLNVLRYIRVNQLREPELVMKHGKALLGPEFSRKISDEMARLAALEQICLAALDQQMHSEAEVCLKRLKEAGIAKDSIRFRLLLARCVEAAGDLSGADLIYDDLLKENPANLLARKRKYCVLRAQPGKVLEAAEALNDYLQQNYADTAGWRELALLRMELGDYKSAVFCLEEVLMGSPSDAKVHCEVAECYATVGGMENLLLARKHMAQALELEPSMKRAQFGLVSVSNAYLLEIDGLSQKEKYDEFEVEVAKELVKFGAEKVIQSYKGKSLFPAVSKLMKEYTDGLTAAN